MIVEVKNVSKEYKIGPDRLQVLLDVTLSVRSGEFLCLLGPSGCGKSTLLRLLAGIEKADKGSIYCGGELVNGPDPSRGFVFQDYALFPWRTVRRNIQFGLQMRGDSRRRQEDIANAYLQLMGLQHVADAYPSQISGGMKQRVAIARALCLQPHVLLMDEPFAALDALTRYKMQEELMRIWELRRITIIFVTHDVEEAVYLADRVAVMDAHPGRMKQIVDIQLPRPRNRTSPHFGKIREELTFLLGFSPSQTAEHTEALSGNLS